MYEKLDLKNTYHKVTIRNTTSGKYLTLDAIDIELEGRMLTESEYYMPHLIKTNSKLIGKNNIEYDLNIDISTIDKNNELIISEIDNAISNLNEIYSIIKIKKET